MRDRDYLFNQSPYKEFLASYVSHATADNYAYWLYQIRSFIGKEIIEATPKQLEAFILNSRDIKKMGSGAIIGQKAAMCSFFKFLIAHELIQADPSVLARQVKIAKSVRTERRALTVEDEAKVFKSLKWDYGIHEYQISLAILFGFKLGFRRMEIAKVEWSHINIAERKIFVLGKGNKGVTLRISSDLTKRLKAFKAIMKEKQIQSKWVFFKHDPEKAYSKTSISKFYDVIEERCEFGKDKFFSPHCGRRNFCTAIHRSGAPDQKAIKATRHAGIATYAGYLRLDDKEIDEVIDKAIP